MLKTNCVRAWKTRKNNLSLFFHESKAANRESLLPSLFKKQKNNALFCHSSTQFPALDGLFS
jgi:hypothetical protein